MEVNRTKRASRMVKLVQNNITTTDIETINISVDLEGKKQKVYYRYL